MEMEEKKGSASLDQKETLEAGKGNRQETTRTKMRGKKEKRNHKLPTKGNKRKTLKPLFPKRMDWIKRKHIRSG